MKRKKISKKKSNKLFKRTARKTKEVNVVPQVMRGGIRL